MGLQRWIETAKESSCLKPVMLSIHQLYSGQASSYKVTEEKFKSTSSIMALTMNNLNVTSNEHAFRFSRILYQDRCSAWKNEGVGEDKETDDNMMEKLKTATCKGLKL